MPGLKGRGVLVGLIWMAVMGICGQLTATAWQLPRTGTMLGFFTVGLVGAALAVFALGNKRPEK